MREETCHYQISPEEIEDFKNEWDEKWQPSIIEKSTGIMRSYEGEETQMAPEEIEDFKNEWDEKWQPSIVEKSTGIMRTFFKKLDNFLRRDN